MNTIIDVTADHFPLLDFDRARVFFSPPSTLKDVIRVEFWGVLLRIATPLPSPKPVISGAPIESSSENLFVAGSGVLELVQPTALDLKVSIYEPLETSERNFIRSPSGRAVSFSKQLRSAAGDLGEAYDLGGFLDFPEGDCNLTIKATGRALFTFDLKDCITASTYERTPVHFTSPAAPPPP